MAPYGRRVTDRQCLASVPAGGSVFHPAHELLQPRLNFVVGRRLAGCQGFGVLDPLSPLDQASSLSRASSYNPGHSTISTQQLGGLTVIYNLLLLGIPSD